jgi:SAM-dependent methyltransferase
VTSIDPTEATRDSLLSDPAVVTRHQRLAALLDSRAGETVLDLGCGDAITIGFILESNPGVRAVGIDLDPEAFAEARHRYPELLAAGALRLVQADLRGPLPIADASIDRVITHSLLELLPEPELLLAEAHRVLRPGGRLVLSHMDSDTFVFAGADLQLTRRIVHAYCDLQQDWMSAVDGTIGRRLPGIADRSPFTVNEVLAWTVLSRGFQPGLLGHGYAHHIAYALGESGALGKDELDGWLADLAHAGSTNEFLFSVNDYTVVCVR